MEVRFEEDDDESDDGEWQGREATAGVTWRPAKVVKTNATIKPISHDRKM